MPLAVPWFQKGPWAAPSPGKTWSTAAPAPLEARPGHMPWGRSGWLFISKERRTTSTQAFLTMVDGAICADHSRRAVGPDPRVSFARDPALKGLH